MYKSKILVVEDDKAIINLIKTTLEVHDYQYQCAKTGKEAITMCLSYNPDVMILDLGLPDMDGVEIIDKVRSWSSLPIIVVSARSEDQDKVQALDRGADDYLTKPFSIDEFLARIRVALRRKVIDKPDQEPSGIYKNGDLTINYLSGCAYLNDEEIHLTPIEYKLLCVFAQNTDKVLTHNFILKEVWGNAFTSDIPSLRVFVTTLRKKLESGSSKQKFIQTHIGVGYRIIRQD